MTESNSNHANWVWNWIEQQHEALRRFNAEGAAWQESAAGPMHDQLHEMGRRWLEIFNACQGTWVAAILASEAAAPGFSDLLARLPPLGPTREHMQAWSELAAAQSECWKLQQELRTVLARVQADALAMLERRLRELEAAGQPPGSQRELYDAWVDCGEQVYAGVAHSDAFCSLQAQLSNALMRLRSGQQKVIEQSLKQFDLPTRSELNTVHRQLRELRGQVAQLQSQLAARDAGQAHE